MAVVFQFHRINQHPLHLSYITFALIAIMTLPSPNESSEDSGRQCFDLGKINTDAVVANKWTFMDEFRVTKSTNDTIKPGNEEEVAEVKPGYEEEVAEVKPRKPRYV